MKTEPIKKTNMKEHNKEFKSHYDEVVSDHDIVNENCGFRCVEVFTKGGSKYNILDKHGNVICKEWYDDEIWMCKQYEEGFSFIVGRVMKGGLFNYIDKNGKLLFPDMWFTRFYNIRKAVGEDGNNYEYSFITRQIKPIQKEVSTSNYCGRYGMITADGFWF